MRFGSMPCPFNAGNAEAPQSISSAALAVSRKKQVLNLPPDPKASPEPTMVSFIGLISICALAKAGDPIIQICEPVWSRFAGERLGHTEYRHAFALGRADTAACQRFTLAKFSGIASLAGFMKSTATSVVMSATE